MNFEFFVMPKCDINGYVCHFKKEDKFMSLSGFVTKDTNGTYHVFISKKSSFNEYNVKEAVLNGIKK